MLGLPDPYILLCFLLCIACAIFCVIYGIINYNKGDHNEEAEIKEELVWQEEENKINELL